MSRATLIARTVLKLGLRNIGRVGLYRLKLKSGWRPRIPSIPRPKGPVFNLESDCETNAQTSIRLFGWYTIMFDSPPDWHADPFDPSVRVKPDCDWVAALNKLGDQDVKNIWELSRFYWLPQFALAARSGDTQLGHRIEQWLQDWTAANPPYYGINWACGQEASIRLMNLALTALILDTWHNPSPALKWLIEIHARRIWPTLSYSLGQDNNHGTAEACSLFIAGSWGQQWGLPNATRFEAFGRRWLNDRALRLIQPDGSPCQYSTTYHRANIEGFCMAGLWSTRTGANDLSKAARARILEGGRWLHSITDPDSGDAPNLGANDSSHLFSVPETAYRDFRPTVALAAALFSSCRPWPDYVDPRLAALDISPGETAWPAARTFSSDAGGFHILRKGNNLALMHYPRFNFRPSQADLLHVDLWTGGQNLLRDDGSFSYAPNESTYFGSCEAHSTVQFDQQDQMPRLGRFLYGDWPKAIYVTTPQDDGQGVVAGAGYRNSRGAEHHRQIRLSHGHLSCTDRVAGPFNSAVLRWRLIPGDYRLEDNTVTGPALALSVRSSDTNIALRLVAGWESRYYRHSSKIPVLEVAIGGGGTIVSEFRF